jgi:hypothetical protein
MAIPTLNRPMFNQGFNQGLGQLTPEAQQTQGIVGALQQTAAQPLQVPSREYQVAGAQPVPTLPRKPVQTVGIAVKPTDLIDGKPSWEFMQQRRNQLWGREDSTDQKDDEDFYLFLKQLREQYGDYAVQSSESSSSPGSLDLLISEAKPDPEESAEGEGAEGEGAVSADNVKLLSNVASQEGKKAVAEGKVDSKTAQIQSAITADKAALLEKPDLTFNEQLKLLDVDQNFNIDNYRKKSKELLGVPPNEADVPEWAAPIFLFGLQLMKGPVSSKQQGQTGFGGLLGDIGAAGTVAFAEFGKERARRQAQRSAVAQLSAKLRGQDITKYAEAMKAYRANLWKQRDYKLKITENINKTMSRDVERYTKGLDIGDKILFETEYTDLLGKIGKTPEAMRIALQNPRIRGFLTSVAAKRSGIAPGIQLKEIKVGAGTVTIDEGGLKRAFGKLSKADRERMNVSTQTALLQKALSDEKPSAQNANIFNQFMISEGVNRGALQLVKKELPGGKSQYVILDKTKPEKAVTWGSPFDTYQPNIQQISLGKSADGKERFATLDTNKLGNLPKGVTFSDMLKNPGAFKQIFTNEDLSNLKDNYMPLTIGDGQNKQVVLLNKTKADEVNQQLLDQGVPGGLASLTTEQKIEKGIYSKLGDPLVTQRAPVSYTRVEPNGTVTQFSGEPGEAPGFFSKVEADKWRKGTTSLHGLHSSAHRITDVLANMPEWSQLQSVSVVADIKARVLGLVSQLDAFPKLKELRSIKDFRGFKKTNSADTEGANNIINKFESSFTNWSKKFAKDAQFNVQKRQQLKSLFVDLAFQMASTREAGKLTDNDVVWAFKTLGWDDQSWFQSPRRVMSGLAQAVETTTDKWNLEAFERMDPKAQNEFRKKWTDAGGAEAEHELKPFDLALEKNRPVWSAATKRGARTEGTYKGSPNFLRAYNANYKTAIEGISPEAKDVTLSVSKQPSGRRYTPVNAFPAAQFVPGFFTDKVRQGFGINPEHVDIWQATFGKSGAPMPTSPGDAVQIIIDWAGTDKTKLARGTKMLEDLQARGLVIK